MSKFILTEGLGRHCQVSWMANKQRKIQSSNFSLNKNINKTSISDNILILMVVHCDGSVTNTIQEWGFTVKAHDLESKVQL